MNKDRKPLILSLDDDQEILKLIEMILLRAGYGVSTVDNPQKAFKFLEKERPDLILVDIMMPEMTGYEFSAKLQENRKWAYTPILFLTALEGEEDKARAFASGAVDYLVKPRIRHDLKKVVESNLKTRNHWNALEKGASKSISEKLLFDFKGFKEFLFKELRLPEDDRKRLSSITPFEIYYFSVDEKKIADKQIAKAVSDYCGLSYVSFINPEDIKLGVLPVPFCRKNLIIAVIDWLTDEERYSVVITNPFDWELLEILGNYLGSDATQRIFITEPDNIRSPALG